MNKSNKFPLLQIPVWCWCMILVGIVSLSTGCANIKSVNHLHQAQQAFNNAASIENKFRLEPLKENSQDKVNSIIELSTARSEYAAALVILQQMSDEEKQMLVNDNLWGVKLTLEGLILWRLGKYDEAFEIIDKAGNESTDQIYPRDVALITALPGQIKIDLAYRKILEVKDKNNTQKNNVLNDITLLLVEMDGGKKKIEWSAIQHINEARSKVNKEHPVNSYLIQSQLAAYRNYKVAYTSIKDGKHSSVPDGSKYRTEAKKNLQALQTLITELKDSAASDTLLNVWKKLCNIELKDEAQ